MRSDMELNRLKSTKISPQQAKEMRLNLTESFLSRVNYLFVWFLVRRTTATQRICVIVSNSTPGLSFALQYAPACLLSV